MADPKAAAAAGPSTEAQRGTAAPDTNIPIPEAPFLTNPCHDEEFFQCSVVALAVKLLGQYLYFHDSKTAVRILETEAYPEGDVVYTKKFIAGDTKLLSMKMQCQLQGGMLLLWQSSGELLVTVGAPEKGDMVLIRSCEPVLGHEEIKKNRKNPQSKKSQKNLLIGPLKVAEGVQQAWLSNNVLFKEGGVQLFYGARDEGEPTKRGKRVLGWIHYFGCAGKDSLFRFALATKMNYKYSKKCGGLHDWRLADRLDVLRKQQSIKITS